MGAHSSPKVKGQKKFGSRFRLLGPFGYINNIKDGIKEPEMINDIIFIATGLGLTFSFWLFITIMSWIEDENNNR